MSFLLNLSKFQHSPKSISDPDSPSSGLLSSSGLNLGVGIKNDNVSQAEWLAVWVKSNFEKIVSQSIRARGIEDFVPTYVRRGKRSHRQELQEPLFPGYIFCRLESIQRPAILRIPGVVSFVGAGRYPIPVDEHEIEVIRRMVTFSASICEWPYTQTGQSVLINKGPLAGIEGIVISNRSAARVVVSITLLKRSLAAEVDIACLTRL